MSVAKIALLALCTVAVARAEGEDYAEWKENKVDRTLTKKKLALYQGSTATIDKCFDQVEDTTGAKIVTYHNDTKVCMLYGKFNINDKNITTESKEGGFSMYFESPEKSEDTSITTTGIILTCILVPLFLICLVTLGFVCKIDETDISSQMKRLEQNELQKEEAVSEHWEKVSQEAEMEAKKEAAPVPEAEEK